MTQTRQKSDADVIPAEIIPGPTCGTYIWPRNFWPIAYILFIIFIIIFDLWKRYGMQFIRMNLNLSGRNFTTVYTQRRNK